jgi:fructuronate reductase
MLPPEIARPVYDRNALQIGVVHLGIGAFHRAHQAWYLDQLLNRTAASGGGPWGICGVSLRSPAIRDDLAPQDGLYTVLTREAERIECRVVGTVKQVLVAPENPGAVLSRLADPATRLVSLTVTEKGYCLDASRRLDPEHPAIRYDRDPGTPPVSTIGFLVGGLRRVRAAGRRPPTILCCDNLPQNGTTLRRALVDFAALGDDRLAAWIEAELACPNSMVDRIVPATTDLDREAVRQALGVDDAGVVSCEPFGQWVLEARFGGEMPDLAAVGVEIVAQTAPYERMKLRVLNGTHSAIAYLGQLIGLEHVADVVADPMLRAFLVRLMTREIGPGLDQLPPAVIAAYPGMLMRRWDNPAIRHRTAQIAMDGSQKLPQRWIATLEEALSVGRPVPCLTFALAVWFRYLGGLDEQGREIPISDPRASELTALAAPGQGSAGIVDAMLDRSGLFPPEIRQAAALRAELVRTLDAIAERGSASAIAALIG